MKASDFRNLYRMGWFTHSQIIFKLMTSFRMTESEAAAFLEQST